MLYCVLPQRKAWCHYLPDIEWEINWSPLHPPTATGAFRRPPNSLSLSLWVSDLDGSSERERETWKLPASDLLEFKAIYITPPPPASPTNLQSRPSSWSQVSLLHLVSAKSGHMSTCQSTRHFLCGGAPADEDTGGSHGAHRSPKVRFRGAQFPTTGQDNSMNYPPKCMRFFSVT